MWGYLSRLNRNKAAADGSAVVSMIWFVDTPTWDILCGPTQSWITCSLCNKLEGFVQSFNLIKIHQPSYLPHFIFSCPNCVCLSTCCPIWCHCSRSHSFWVCRLIWRPLSIPTALCPQIEGTRHQSTICQCITLLVMFMSPIIKIMGVGEESSYTNLSIFVMVAKVCQPSIRRPVYNNQDFIQGLFLQYQRFST